MALCFLFVLCFVVVVLFLKLLYISLKQNLLLFSFTRKRYSDVKNKYNLVERRFHCYEDLGQTPEVFADISIRPQFCHSSSWNETLRGSHCRMKRYCTMILMEVSLETWPTSLSTSFLHVLVHDQNYCGSEITSHRAKVNCGSQLFLLLFWSERTDIHNTILLFSHTTCWHVVILRH